jgi:hypothetical protein
LLINFSTTVAENATIGPPRFSRCNSLTI